jgi:hypothetical protein
MVRGRNGVLSALTGLSIWAAPQTLTGQISDSMCGKSHAGMGDMGKNAKECTLGCVKAGGKYVFVSGDKVYDIKNQNFCGARSERRCERPIDGRCRHRRENDYRYQDRPRCQVDCTA